MKPYPICSPPSTPRASPFYIALVEPRMRDRYIAGLPQPMGPYCVSSAPARRPALQ
ncbi:hypothetical protein SBBP2_1130003 [Burkholderiales bacterium]|nr:hypothetical protein SBBP2_1130003 [Burkholderiales bacterium]